MSEDQKIIGAMSEYVKRYNALTKACVRLKNQIWAIEQDMGEGYPSTLDLAEGLMVLEEKRKAAKKELEKLAKGYPMWEQVRSIRGLGAASFVQIVGELRGFLRFPTVAKVWKWMGLGVGPEGKPQRRVAGQDILIEGFCPRRRALMHVVGTNLIKAKNEYYGAIYRDRKAYEQEKAPELKLIHHHKRAMRYMEKRLLKDLWTIARNQDPYDAHRAFVSNDGP